MRPTSFTAELGDTICGLLAEGQSLRKVCALKGYPHISTVLDWVMKGSAGDERYSTFSDQYARAMDLRTEFLAEEILDISDNKGSDIKRDAAGLPIFDDAGNPIIDHDGVQRARLQIDTRKWLMGKLKPKKYGDKLAHVGGNPDDGDKPIAHSIAVVFK